MGQIQSGPPEMGVVRQFSFSASGTDGLWRPDGEEGVTWCSRHSGTHAPGCDTLHKQESIGGTACATGVGFGGFRLDSFRGRLESGGWICGGVKVPPVTELHPGNIATLLPQHVGRTST